MRPHELLRRAGRAAWSTRRARAFTIVAAALALALAARAGRARSVPAYAVERRPLVQRVVASGRVMAPARITLASLSLAKVVEVAAREGEPVRAGQLVVRPGEVIHADVLVPVGAEQFDRHLQDLQLLVGTEVPALRGGRHRLPPS